MYSQTDDVFTKKGCQKYWAKKGVQIKQQSLDLLKEPSRGLNVEHIQ